MSMARRFRRNFRRNLPKMELKMTLGDVLAAFDAANALADAPFADPVTAVKIGQVHRALAPLYEDINRKRGDLIDKHAERDEDGNIIYTNAEKTMVKPTRELFDKLNDLLAGETEVTLPQIDAAKIGIGDGDNLTPAAIYPLRMALTGLNEQDATIKRGDVEGAVDAIGNLFGESFASCTLAPRLALAQGVLLKLHGEQVKRRQEIAEEHAERDEYGNIVYLDKEQETFTITPPARAAIDAYAGEKITLGLPELRADEFVLASGKGISPRRMYGLMPLLTV